MAQGRFRAEAAQAARLSLESERLQHPKPEISPASSPDSSSPQLLRWDRPAHVWFGFSGLSATTEHAPKNFQTKVIWLHFGASSIMGQLAHSGTGPHFLRFTALM
jgi:hypothetical protein